MNPRITTTRAKKPRERDWYVIGSYCLGSLMVLAVVVYFAWSGVFSAKAKPVDHTEHRFAEAAKVAAKSQENAATSDSLRKHIASELDIANQRITQLVEQLNAARLQVQYFASLPSRLRDEKELLECEMCVMSEQHDEREAFLIAANANLSRELSHSANEGGELIGGKLVQPELVAVPVQENEE